MRLNEDNDAHLSARKERRTLWSLDEVTVLWLVARGEVSKASITSVDKRATTLTTHSLDYNGTELLNAKYIYYQLPARPMNKTELQGYQILTMVV